MIVLTYDTPQENEILPYVIKGNRILKKLISRYGYNLTNENLEYKGNYGMENTPQTIDESIEQAAEEARTEGVSEEVIVDITRRVKQNTDQLLRLREHPDERNG